MPKGYVLHLYLDKKDMEEIENLMASEIQTDDGMVLFRVHEGKTRMEFYRKLIRAGMAQVILDFKQKKRDFEKRGGLKK